MKTMAVPDEIAESLRSQNPVRRGTAIFKLASGGYSAPELVEPLVNDSEPFMFGIPVRDAANAYMVLISGMKYDGPFKKSIHAIAQEMADEWGKGTLL